RPARHALARLHRGSVARRTPRIRAPDESLRVFLPVLPVPFAILGGRDSACSQLPARRTGFAPPSVRGGPGARRASDLPLPQELGQARPSWSYARTSPRPASAPFPRGALAAHRSCAYRPLALPVTVGARRESLAALRPDGSSLPCPRS